MRNALRQCPTGLAAIAFLLTTPVEAGSKSAVDIALGCMAAPADSSIEAEATNSHANLSAHAPADPVQAFLQLTELPL